MPPYTEAQRSYWHSAFACGPPTETRFTITSGIARARLLVQPALRVDGRLGNR